MSDVTEVKEIENWEKIRVPRKPICLEGPRNIRSVRLTCNRSM